MARAIEEVGTLKCPFCDGRMERGHLAAESVRRGETTRLEWFDKRPMIASVDGVPVSGYGNPGSREAFRCSECGAIAIL